MSPESIKRILEFASNNGFTDIFAQVRGRGDALYHSEFVPRPQELPDSTFDPLQTLIDVAGSTGIRVHAWLNVYLLWTSQRPPENPEHLYHRHPEWSAVNKALIRDVDLDFSDFQSNQLTGVFLSPLELQVSTYLCQVLEELLQNYNVDGVHLDYIRFPNSDYDYISVARDRFQELYGIDPTDLNYPERITALDAYDAVLLLDEWNNFRRQAITQLVIAFRQIIEQQQPEITLSAAVIADPIQARNFYFQDWIGWMREGLLDFAVPMNYTTDNAEFRKINSEIAEMVSPDRVWMGIATYNQTSQAVREKCEICLDSGFRNLVFFSYDQFAADPSYLQRLKKFLKAR
jgi:uncharacterized lipoprotein YddW (UPF0748 family)